MAQDALLPAFRDGLTQWLRNFDVTMILDNHAQQNACNLHSYEMVIAAGVKKYLLCEEATGAMEKLKNFMEEHGREYPQGKPFLFGHLAYDLKNGIEQLQSAHPDRIGFPALFFFIPQHLILVDREGNVEGDEHTIREILSLAYRDQAENAPQVLMKQRVNKTQYLHDVEKIRQHIIEGDVYELNYCVEFYAEGAVVDPYRLYHKLSAASPTPFGAFYKYIDRYLLCASPERFMKKEGEHLYSQPIKGTARRGQDEQEDLELKRSLLDSEKERAENLMIVDLVRNDLARSSETGSVKVDELFGIYSFSQVHQMISTISSSIREEVHAVEAIKNAFPMGSMTGAPKISAMELIEKFEQTRRGLYSGAVGYFTPETDFDLNVVIRSLQYNATAQYLNFEVGGAITYDSVAEQEYEECLLKARAMLSVLGAL